MLKSLVASILVIAFLSSLIVLCDTSILVPMYFYDFWIIIFAIIIVLIGILFFIFITYRYVRKPYILAMNGIQEEDNLEKEDVDNYTIFVHDKTEEEQLDELFESHMKEMEKKDGEDLEE